MAGSQRGCSSPAQSGSATTYASPSIPRDPERRSVDLDRAGFTDFQVEYADQTAVTDKRLDTHPEIDDFGLEEILQEAFLQAWERAATYRPERATPKGWLLLMARSRALDRIRSATARGRREKAVYANETLASVATPRGTERLEAEERSGLLGQALAVLPAEQRKCIELAFLEGLTHRQVAERTGEPLGTVKSRIALGMNKLRQALASP